MKIAFVADTPYQIMNCIVLASTKYDFTKGKIDIYIGLQFSGGTKIVDRLKEIEFFFNVFLFEPNRISKKTIISRIIEIANPGKVLQQLLISESSHIGKNEYDYIYLSIFTKFSVALIYKSNAKVILYDDGIGNYLGSTWQKGIPQSHKIVYALLGKNPRKLMVEKRYVVNKILWNLMGNSLEKVEEMPPINADNSLEYLHHVFDYSNNEYYSSKKIIYLTQPVTQCEIGNRLIETGLIDELRKSRIPFFIRQHPRDKGLYKKEEVDSCGAMWELACHDQIRESHVLIGMFSTAQFTPKILYNKEVIVVFTYKLYRNIFSEDALCKIDDMIKKLEIAYQSTNKIFVPKDLVEYRTILHSVLM